MEQPVYPLYQHFKILIVSSLMDKIQVWPGPGLSRRFEQLSPVFKQFSLLFLQLFSRYLQLFSFFIQVRLGTGLHKYWPSLINPRPGQSFSAPLQNRLYAPASGILKRHSPIDRFCLQIRKCRFRTLVKIHTAGSQPVAATAFFRTHK